MLRLRTCHLITLAFVAISPALFAQGSSEEGRLRALNAEALRLRGLLQSATATEQGQIRAQAVPVFEQRQTLLESLMPSLPGTALQLSFPVEVLSDLATAFPQSAGRLETRGVWQGHRAGFEGVFAGAASDLHDSKRVDGVGHVSAHAEWKDRS